MTGENQTGIKWNVRCRRYAKSYQRSNTHLSAVNRRTPQFFTTRHPCSPTEPLSIIEA